MNLELPPQEINTSEDPEQAHAFDELFDEAVSQKNEQTPKIQYELPYSKEDFLRHLVKSRNVLLHGSSVQDLEILEPRQANDSEKKSGNQNAVYAVKNPVFPIFYAIQNRANISGIVRSGVERDGQGNEVYYFELPKTSQGKDPWKRGVVYILDKDVFDAQVDDDGNPSNEWISKVSVRPLAALEVGPEDFRFLNNVEYTT